MKRLLRNVLMVADIHDAVNDQTIAYRTKRIHSICRLQRLSTSTSSARKEFHESDVSDVLTHI